MGGLKIACHLEEHNSYNMKTILTVLLGVFACTSTFAQKIMVSFKGDPNQIYRVLIDGNLYNPDNAINVNNIDRNNAQKTISINNLTPGTHKIAIYNQVNGFGNRNRSMIYSNSFLLRPDNDLYISLDQNWISFSEKLTPVTDRDMGNRGVMSDNTFRQLALEIKANRYESARVAAIREAMNSSDRYTVSQISELLALINTENSRMELAKLSYDNIVDPQNFSSLNSLFTTQANRAELNDFIRSRPNGDGNDGNRRRNGNGTYAPVHAAMDNRAFTQLLDNAGNHILPWDKVKDVKAAFSDPNNYFTSDQARQLMFIVSTGNILSVPEANRVELAKLAYARVIDPINFQQVIDLFSDRTSREELNSYVRLQAGKN